MTDHETNAIRELSGDVKELSHKVEELRLEVRQNMEREKATARDVAAIHCEVFGIDGDPSRPGLKGQIRDVNSLLDHHEDRLELIKARESWGLSLLQSLVLLVAGALMTVACRHWLP